MSGLSANSRQSEGGFTLVEFLVAMVVVLVLMAVTMTAVTNTGDLVTTASRNADLNEEARQAVNRMVRDVRQSTTLVTAVNPDGPGFDSSTIVAFRFEADYDGDGCIGGGSSPCLPYDAANPEDLTYCYQPDTAQLYVIDNDATASPLTASSTTCEGGQPLLAGNVAEFRIEYRSNAYLHDLAPSDGVTTWMELDAATPPVGNGNGILDDELASVDSLVFGVVMQLDGSRQTYRTQVDLRNQSR
jgi:prepilin-type N-terminal cleavage/methylation domain-containing protein